MAMRDDTGRQAPSLEELLTRAGLTCSVAQAAHDLGVEPVVLRHHFDRSPNALAAAKFASANEAKAMLARLGQKAARATKRAARLAEEAAAATDPVNQALDRVFECVEDALSVLDDIGFEMNRRGRWACRGRRRRQATCIRVTSHRRRCRNAEPKLVRANRASERHIQTVAAATTADYQRDPRRQRAVNGHLQASGATTPTVARGYYAHTRGWEYNSRRNRP